MAATKKTEDTKEKGVPTQAGALRDGAEGASDPWQIMEPVTVPRLQNSRNQPDMAVSVNGRIFKIQRGVQDVMVPRPIAQVVRRSLRATDDAADAYYRAAGIKEV